MSKRISPCLLASILLFAIEAKAAPFVYNDFSSVAGLQLNGSAHQQGNALRLTDAVGSQSGTAFRTTAVPLTNDYSFSTFFSFLITGSGGIGDEDGAGADGITFIVQTTSNTAGGAGGGIGYQGIANSMAVEFDTYNNGLPLDINGNHVGIDLHGSVTSVASVAVVPRFNNGQIWFSWVDYNGTTDLLEVRVSTTSIRPVAATLTHVVNLATVLNTPNAFVGFGAGTGSGVGNHDILSWEFRDTFDPVATVPEPTTITLVGLGALALARKRARRRS